VTEGFQAAHSARQRRSGAQHRGRRAVASGPRKKTANRLAGHDAKEKERQRPRTERSLSREPVKRVPQGFGAAALPLHRPGETAGRLPVEAPTGSYIICSIRKPRPRKCLRNGQKIVHLKVRVQRVLGGQATRGRTNRFGQRTRIAQLAFP
jgi:hypothetical protein